MINLSSVLVQGAPSTNQKGDLFATSMRSLFTVLGYQDFRLNIHKTGREIDIEAVHTTENKRLLAECKATEDPIGGKDINTLMGKVNVEQLKDPASPIQAYFLSLSGFTESAIEQEREAGRRVALIDGGRAVEILVKSQILIDPVLAAEMSGRFAQGDPALQLHRGCHLVISHLGNLWLFFYTKGKEKTSFTLIHADNTPIAPKHLVSLNSDPAFRQMVSGLDYLIPELRVSDAIVISDVRKKYHAYLANVCGQIQFDGLPADQEVGAKKIQMEDLFVPMRLVPAIVEQGVHLQRLSNIEDELDGMGNASPEEASTETKPLPLGSILSKSTRMAVLGLPGAGKSMVIKRLAIAYSFPERKALIKDNLPDRNWLPILLRCRQLGSQVKSPILEILDNIRIRAEIEDSHEAAFSSMIREAIKSGEALLLIDGLDEISSESNRVAFVAQLRLFLAQYPGVSLILTSRNAGFRVIGTALVSECNHYNLASFTRQDIATLTLSWYRIVVGNRKDTRDAAIDLANTICNNFRLLKLAENPLLLTTLLVVKRWVSQLPTKRSALYARAVEVLLMTWNVEGHQPLDPEEIIPQLSFVALQMMMHGVQRITYNDLQRELYEARKSLPEILSFTKMSVPDVISSVELRSSLLILSGHELKDGVIQGVYEFRHLLFQEYLAAKAITESYLPDGKNLDAATILRPHLKKASWEEVILLSASLGGRRSALLMRKIIDSAAREPTEVRSLRREQLSARDLIVGCLEEEVPLASADLDIALQEIIPLHLVTGVHSSRYADRFREICSKELWEPSRFKISQSGGHIGELDYWRLAATSNADVVSGELMHLISGEGKKSTEALFACMNFAYNKADMGRRAKRGMIQFQKEGSPELRERMKGLCDMIAQHLESEITQVQVGALWALAWFGEGQLWDIEHNTDSLRRMFALWATALDPDVNHFSAWAISALPLRSAAMWSRIRTDTDSSLAEKVRLTLDRSKPRQQNRQVEAALLFSMYNRRPIQERERFIRMLKDQQRKLGQEAYSGLLISYLQCDSPEEFDPENMPLLKAPSSEIIV